MKLPPASVAVAIICFGFWRAVRPAIGVTQASRFTAQPTEVDDALE